jgi:hypothetical protein
LILRLENRLNKVFKYCLLTLFIGYYGSITLFYHSHIVLGETIVHSHPYKTGSNGYPLHSHTDKGYITIQFLSFFAFTFLFVYFNFKTIAPLVFKIISEAKEGLTYHIFHYIYLLRAPPHQMLKSNLIFSLQPVSYSYLKIN